MYIELHTSSAFSFLDGATLPERMVERAAELGYPALALLDRDGVYGAPRFHQAATAAGIKPIIGCELTIRASGATPRGQGPEAGGRGSNPESRIPNPEQYQALGTRYKARMNFTRPPSSLAPGP